MLSDERRLSYLQTLVFGRSVGTPLRASVAVAYGDLQRTLHGVRRQHDGASLRDEAHKFLASAIERLIANLPACKLEGQEQQADFDAWHRATVEELRTIYRRGGYGSFTVGHGQKWVNMALKYAVTFGEAGVPGIERLIAVLHVPLDNVLLEALAGDATPRLSARWSRLADYDEYAGFQHWFRARFPEQPPLLTEFELWERGMRAARASAV